MFGGQRPHKPTLSPHPLISQAIASIVDAYSRVGCSDPEVLDALVARVAASPEGLSGEALCKVVTATVQLGCEDERLLGQLLDAMAGKLDDATPRAIVKMVEALGELRLRHAGLLATLTDRTLPERLTEFQAGELSSLVNALNKLGYYNQNLMALLHRPAGNF